MWPPCKRGTISRPDRSPGDSWGRKKASSTKATVIGRQGGPEVFEEREVDMPAPGPNEVLVRVRASSVNPADVGARRGVFGPHGVALPAVLGCDVAGVIEQVGSGVTSSHAADFADFPLEPGGEIASLAGVAYLLRDGGVPGENVTVFEESGTLGGSLDGRGSPEEGYVMRGGRMFTDEVYTCTHDPMRDEMPRFNEEVHSHARLVAKGKKLESSHMGLSQRDRRDLIELFALPEEALDAKRIEDYFRPPSFKTNFWYEWCTTFAFQPRHSLVEFRRYCRRFLQEFPRISTREGVKRTPLNQYDSLVRPLTQWLQDRGVRFALESRVVDPDLTHGPEGMGVERIHLLREGGCAEVEVGPQDLVFVTNGSMTAASSFGTMTSPAPILGPEAAGGSWALWETLAQKDAAFRRPSVFSGHVAESNWLSFTTTC